MRTRRYVPLTRYRPRTFLASRYPLLASVAVLLLASVIVSSPAPVRAASNVVTTCASSGPGSLPVVLDAAITGDTITFMQDCTGPNAIILTATLAPTVNITIDTIESGHTVTISGGGKVQLFYIGIGIALSLRGLTLANGNTGNNSGAAIRTYGTVSIMSCTFSDNATTVANGGAIYSVGTMDIIGSTFFGNSSSKGKGSGGAIFNNGGTASIKSSTFVANTTSDGGGAVINYKGTLNVVNSTFSANIALVGGGAIANRDKLNVRGSTFAANTATGDYYIGGAITNSGTANVVGSTFSANTAFSGGAIGTLGALSVVNSTFSDNTANGGEGGAIGIGKTGRVTVVGSTVFGNTATNNGGGIDHVDGSTLRLALSVVAGNTAGFDSDISGPVNTDSGGNVVGNTAGSSGLNTSTNKLNTNPLLAPLASNGGAVQTFALMPGSPAIGIAPCPTDPITMMPLATDARGVSRPQGAYCDAGSYQTSAGP